MALQYWVVVKKNAKELADEVNQFLADGWTLQGGVSITARAEDFNGSYASNYGTISGKLTGSATIIAQALVKEIAE